VIVGGLFDGIGLLAYGLHLAGLQHAWLCEVDPWRRSMLELRFPGVVAFDDVRGVGAASAGPVDVIAGGFPCYIVERERERVAA
jgi:DNA (cytosine-5)-methyltransferase 1